MKAIGFFDEDDRLERLSEMGDPLEKVSKVVNWEIFRPLLNKAMEREDRGVGGRPAWDYILMFKILLLQAWYAIADDKTEYLINDRLSFQRFLGITLGSKVPDAKTIWLFRENVRNSGVDKELFALFAKVMENEGVITRRGTIVDATFVDVPRQRNTKEETQKIKEGQTPEKWQEPKNAAKLEQKDLDARWTKKNNETHYGYKDHVKVDSDSKIIVEYEVTAASVHDSQEIVGLVDEKDEKLYGDSAFVGEKLHEEIKGKNPAIELKINEKGYRNRPLTQEQKASNKEKSRIRARVEHVFGHMSNSMGGLYIRCIGLDRAKCVIGFKNLAYNLSRYTYLVGAKKAPSLV